MDISTITAAFGAAKSIKEIGKGLLSAKIDDEVKNQFRELLEKIGTFQESLYYLREELLGVQDEKQELNEKVKELEAKLALQSEVHYIKPSYWRGDGDDKDGPFCQKCYDVDGKLVRLQGEENDNWRCNGCEKVVHGTNYHRYTEEHTMPLDTYDGY